MNQITINITIPKESEQIPLVRAIIRVIGFARTLLKKIEKGEAV